MENKCDRNNFIRRVLLVKLPFLGCTVNGCQQMHQRTLVYLEQLLLSYLGELQSYYFLDLMKNCNNYTRHQRILISATIFRYIGNIYLSSYLRIVFQRFLQNRQEC